MLVWAMCGLVAFGGGGLEGQEGEVARAYGKCSGSGEVWMGRCREEVVAWRLCSAVRRAGVLCGLRGGDGDGGTVSMSEIPKWDVHDSP